MRRRLASTQSRAARPARAQPSAREAPRCDAREPPTRFDELRAASARRDAAACAKPPRPRSLCLAVAARAGALAEVFAAQDDAADDGGAAARAAMDDSRAAIAPAAGALLAALVRVAAAAHVDLGAACARNSTARAA